MVAGVIRLADADLLSGHPVPHYAAAVAHDALSNRTTTRTAGSRARAHSASMIDRKSNALATSYTLIVLLPAPAGRGTSRLL